MRLGRVKVDRFDTVRLGQQLPLIVSDILMDSLISLMVEIWRYVR